MAAETRAGLNNMSKAVMLRDVVVNKLTTAAQEIFATVERTVTGYEEEASGLRHELDRLRRQLELLAQPEIKVEPTGRNARSPLLHTLLSFNAHVTIV